MGVGAVGEHHLNRLIQVGIDQNRADKVTGHLMGHSFRNINDNIRRQDIFFFVRVPSHLFWQGFEIDLVVRYKQKRARDDKCEARIIKRLVPKKGGVFLVLKNKILLFI